MAIDINKHGYFDFFIHIFVDFLSITKAGYNVAMRTCCNNMLSNIIRAFSALNGTVATS